MAKSFLTSTPPVVCVHDGVMHADEIFSVACVKILNPNTSIIRTRDTEVLSRADFRIDVGGKYDPETGDYDHHQGDFNERHVSPSNRYEKGPKLSGFGLIWRHYGRDVIRTYLTEFGYPVDDEGVDFIWDSVDRALVAPIDACDNGEGGDFFLDTGAYRMPTIMKHIQNLVPAWIEKSPEMEQKTFDEAVQFASGYLKREIVRGLSVHLGKYKLLELADNLAKEGKDILILEEFIPWSPIFSRNAERTSHIKMVIFPSTNGWLVQSPYFNKKYDSGKFSQNMPDGTPRKSKYPAPKHIWGKEASDLSKITGVEDAIFVHATGFICGAASKVGALKLARYIIENQDV